MTDGNKYSEILKGMEEVNANISIAAEQFNRLDNLLSQSSFLSSIEMLKTNASNFLQFESVLPKLDVETLKFPAIFELSRKANLSMSRLAMETNLNLIAPLMLTDTANWAKQINPIISLSESINNTPIWASLESTYSNLPKISEFFVQSNLSKMAEVSLLAESTLSKLKMDFGNIEAGLFAEGNISKSLLALSDTYSNLFATFNAMPENLINLGPSIARLTPIEYFNETNLCYLLDSEKAPKETTSLEKEIVEENELGLRKYLPQINKDLVNLWEGANLALKSNNPDRIRHFAASVRELLTHVLHLLAPTESIRNWTNEPKYYYNNQPTRCARLMYICRNINDSAFEKFVEKDVAATLEFINLFQEGTHTIKSRITEQQLGAMKVRAEATIKYIIEISRV